MDSFKQLGLSTEILSAIEDLGFETPSKIQQKAIPFLVAGGRDFIGLAQTGTGKTAAFGLPLLERIDPFVDGTQALILAPTRELGQQITRQLDLYSKHLFEIDVLAVYGGTSITNQIKALKKGPQIVVATPGRLLDLIRRKAIKLKALRFLILDEADEMLNMGFKPDIDDILTHVPDHKETWLFSATMAKDIRSLVNTYMTNPVEVAIDAKDKVNSNIDHRFILVKRDQKTEVLCRFMETSEDMRAIVFCRTKRDTQDLSDQLNAKNYRADAIHGDLQQRQRDRVMNRFRSGELQLLVATDVAARGIDVDDLTHVFHFALPDDLAYYTHRSGRTARAGKEGLSVIFATPNDRHRLNQLSSKLNITFSPLELPNQTDIVKAKLENWCFHILKHSGKKKKHAELVDYAHTIFAGLSKEELINKMINVELEKLKESADLDLPTEFQTKGGGGRSRGRGRGGSGRSRDRRSSGSSRRTANSSRKSKDYRSFKKKDRRKKRK